MRGGHRNSLASLLVILLSGLSACLGLDRAAAGDGDFVVRDFRFKSGETLPELRLHYLTLGQPARDRQGRVANAVLILHGTGGSGRQFMAPQFAGVLFGPGALLDTARYDVILPDGIGHGRSSKPSDGLHARFPHYEYDDMVIAQYRLVTEHLGIRHLRLVMGTSMGGMHTWMWGEAYPDFMDALMPLACLPVPIAGRNRLWRRMIIEAIRGDPEWKDGEYASEPLAALRTALDLLLIAGSAPMQMQKSYPVRDSADQYLEMYTRARLHTLDANDLLYQVDASRDYDPSPRLEQIRAPLVHVNSADDFINPPELGIAEREIKRVNKGRFVLIPASDVPG
ncbi:MAG: alpha/beta fold hydrolase [Chloroflexi bacterium]|nr:MAG: alpha/beta fold hydrolase [Chloroflexota bacterium]